MPRKTAKTYDTAAYLDSPEMIVAYLNEAFASGDAALIYAAVGDVARAKGMTAIAKETGTSREHLYTALSAEGKPEFATVMKTLSALGIQLEVKAA